MFDAFKLPFFPSPMSARYVGNGQTCVHIKYDGPILECSTEYSILSLLPNAYKHYV